MIKILGKQDLLLLRFRGGIEKIIPINQLAGELTAVLQFPSSYNYGFVSSFVLNGKTQTGRKFTLKQGDILKMNYVCEYNSESDTSKNERELISIFYDKRRSTTYTPNASSGGTGGYDTNFGEVSLDDTFVIYQKLNSTQNVTVKYANNNLEPIEYITFTIQIAVTYSPA